MEFKDLLSPISGLGNNIANMLWSDSQNEKAFERQQKLMQMQIQAQERMYKEYLSPQAVAQQLKEIGVNPAAHFGKGGMSVGSMPSVSAPSVSGSYGQALPLENIGTNFINSVSALAQARKNTSESTAIDEKLEHEIDLLIANKNSAEANAAYQNFLTALHKEKLPRHLESEITRNFRLASFYGIQGDTEKAKRKYYNALETLTQNQSKLSAEFASHASEYVTKIMDNLKSQTEANRAQKIQSYALAGYYSALRSTEDGLRSGKITLQNLSIDMSRIAADVSRIEKGEMLETQGARLQGIIQQYRNQGLISEKLSQEIKSLAYSNNVADVRLAMDILSTGANAAGSLGSAYNGYISNLNGAERNKIQQSFNQAWERVQNRPKVTEHYMHDSSSGGFVPVWRQELK